MKRIVLAATLSSLALFAAVAAHAGAEFGFKAGVTGSNLTGKIRHINSPTMTLDATGGLMLAVPVVGHLLAVQGEALFVSKGAHIPQTVANPVGGDDQLKLDYVEIPVMARFDVPAGLPFTPFLLAGPSFAYNIQAKYTPGDPSQPSHDLADVRKLDTGLALGAGVRIPLVGMKLTAEGRFTPSLQTVQNDPNAAVPGKNSVYTFMAGLVF